MNFAVQMLMNKLQGVNPKAYQFVSTAMTNGGDTNAILNSVLGGSSPEQKQALISQAKQYGCPETILKQIEKMK